MARAKKSQNAGAIGATTLAVPRASQRFAALLEVRDRLLKQIAQKKRELARAETKLEQARTEVLAILEPLWAKCADIQEAIHRAFATLLAPGRLSKRRRREVVSIYRSLVVQGILDRCDIDEARTEPEADSDDDMPPFTEPSAQPGAGGYSAPQPAADGTRESLRALFKRLAVALHPDRVQSEDEKQRLTEAMKEVTRAYEEGDLARLLEIERDQAWHGGPRATAEENEKLGKLERLIAELKEQLSALFRALRALKRSEAFRMLQEFQRVRAHGGDPAAEISAELESELAELRAVREHVCAFAAGKMEWDVFVAGPATRRSRVREEEELFEELVEIFEAAPPKKRRKRRKTASDAIPF